MRLYEAKVCCYQILSKAFVEFLKFMPLLRPILGRHQERN